MDVDVYIKDDKEVFHLPVNPFSVTINYGKHYETFDILYKGEVDFPAEKAKKIKTMTMDIVFPEEYEPYCRYRDIPIPDEAVGKIERYINSSKPVRLIITGLNFNEMVHFVDYQESNNGENQGDRYLSLNIRVVKEEISVVAKAVARARSASSSPSLKGRPKSKQEKIYIVKSGDSLYKIAKKTLGNGSKYNELYAANKSVIGKDPNKIFPGQKLIIPG